MLLFITQSFSAFYALRDFPSALATKEMNYEPSNSTCQAICVFWQQIILTRIKESYIQNLDL